MAKPANLDGRMVTTGAYGTMTWDGELVLEVTSVDVGADLDRSDVYVGLDKDSKLNGLGGTISFAIDHVYSRSAKLLEALKAGRDPRVVLNLTIEDPDAVGGGIERLNIANVWFNKIPMIGFQKGEHNKREYECGYRVQHDTEYGETI